MSERAPYSRVYWSAADDPKFEAIWDNNDYLATWLRLLIAADGAHPSSVPIPAWAKKRPLAALADAGLLDFVGASRYRIHGLAAERTRRESEQRNGGQVRIQNARRGPDGRLLPSSGGPAVDTSSGDQRDQLRRDEAKTRRGSTRESLPGDDGRADLEAFLLLTRRAPSPRQRQLLDGLLDRHDLTGPQWAADIMLRHPDDPIGAVIEADKAWRAERIAEAQAADKPKPIPRRRRGLPESTREILAHWAKKEPA